jgi:hypothetical protein
MSYPQEPIVQKPVEETPEEGKFSIWLGVIRDTAIKLISITALTVSLASVTQGVKLHEIPLRTYLIATGLGVSLVIIIGIIILLFIAARHGRVVNLKRYVGDIYLEALDRSGLNPLSKDKNSEHPTTT